MGLALGFLLGISFLTAPLKFRQNPEKTQNKTSRKYELWGSILFLEFVGFENEQPKTNLGCLLFELKAPEQISKEQEQ